MRQAPKITKITFCENQPKSSMSIQNHSNDFLMTPRHHLNVLESILRTPIFLNSHDFVEIVTISQCFPASWRDGTDTIGKTSKIIIIPIENSSFDGLEQRYRGSKRSPECRQEEPQFPRDASLCWPGGECVAPFMNWHGDFKVMMCHKVRWAQVYVRQCHFACGKGFWSSISEIPQQ